MRDSLRWFAAAFICFSMCSPAAAAWHEAKSKHFIIYADLKPDQIRNYAEKLERFDAAVRHARMMDDPPLTDSNRLSVYVLNSQEAVGALAGSSMVAGQYSARASGSVAFVPRKAGGSSEFDLDALTIFFHEYAHHLQLQSMDQALPAWIVEGFAEFFATAKIEKDGSVIIGSPPLYRAHSLFHASGLNLEEMLGGTYRNLDAQSIGLFYGKGWLLTHYLSFNRERSGQLLKYVSEIQKGHTALQSARAAFGDLKLLDRELDRYMRGRLSSVRVVATKIPIAPIQVRRMTDGEGAIMKVRIRSKYGVNQKTAPGVAEQARRAALPYPRDAFVQATLAETEYDAGNYAAAEAAADRALQANPNDVHALIYKGRARVELAKAQGSDANWNEVRKWFQRANKLDTENAEPLMLFYKTYLDAGQPPSKSAVDALLYASVLVPQDEGLRLSAVMQLLRDDRVADAKVRFAPLAFKPHAPEQWRSRAASVMSALDRKDAKGALQALQAPDMPAAKQNQSSNSF